MWNAEYLISMLRYRASSSSCPTTSQDDPFEQQQYTRELEKLIATHFFKETVQGRRLPRPADNDEKNTQSAALWKYKAFNLAMVKTKGYTLQYALYQNDIDVVLAAVTNDGLSLKYADESFQANRDVVLAAVTNNGLSLQYANRRLRKNKKIVIAAVTNNGIAFHFIKSSSLKMDRDVVLAAVGHKSYYDRQWSWRSDPLVLEMLQKDNSKFIRDKVVVFKAVQNNGRALQYADASLQADRDIVLAAVTNGSDSEALPLQYADASLQSDRDVVLVAVTTNGEALRYADASLQVDRDVVLAAITNKGSALQYADTSLQVDRDVVLAAITNKGSALQYADQ